MVLRRVTKLWRTQGAAGLATTIADRTFHRSAGIAGEARLIAEGAVALEVGGASSRFRRHRLVPIYPYVATIDNVNFAGATLWERGLRDGGDYAPDGIRRGTQYLREAGQLAGLSDASYDMVISSHTLEHLANPLPALREWRRVCRPGGHVVIVVPHRDATFDRRRAVTTIEHLYDDDAMGVSESDMTHRDDILRHHDFTRDPDATPGRAFEERIAKNRDLRAMHHHVFDIALTITVLRAAGWTPTLAEARRPHDIVAIAVNATESLPVEVRASPFRADRPLLARR